MARFVEAENRIFKNMFVCRRCKGKQRAPIMKVLAGKVRCRRCSYATLRVIKKK
jgi:ribosomal protein L40E